MTQQSRPEAVEMEDMPTGQFLVAAAGRHVLAADDADAVRVQIRLACVAEALIHIGCDSAIPQEICHAVAKVSEGPVEVSHLQHDYVVLNYYHVENYH